jgi:alpha-galactosidase
MAEANKSEIVASHVSREIRLDSAKPVTEWQTAQPIRFSADWQGRNPEPALETEVRVLWSPRILYLRFVCSYRQLCFFHDSDPNGRRDHLWDRDVAEIFLQPQPSRERYYKEFEIAPNGMWIDLDISPSGLADLKSGLSRSVHVDQEKHIWTAEMAIPVEAITKRFDPGSVWRANFYRIEGPKEPRRYMAWRPTHTPQPNFHVPKAFGTMRFETD